MARSLEKMREMEESVKLIPILQVTLFQFARETW